MLGGHWKQATFSAPINEQIYQLITCRQVERLKR